MPLFKEADIRSRARQSIPAHKAVGTVLTEKAQRTVFVSSFDIFLSHSFGDQELILGTWLAIEDLGYKVYVDWIHDRQLSRDSVTKKTAEVLRARMKSCKCLFYATTQSSGGSKWMPWELGYMDGLRNRAAILPVSYSESYRYEGQEYLGVYPFVTRGKNRLEQEKLWIRTSPTCYVEFESWLNGEEPSEKE